MTEATDRFWCPREGSLPLSDRGYLHDPTGVEDIAFPVYDLFSLDRLRSFGCLALLGEPGMGKSTVVNEWTDRFSGMAAEAVMVDLGQYGSEDRLVREVFDSDSLRRWQEEPTSRLHLILDSLDECQTRVSHVAQVLVGQLRQLPTFRLELWVVCRTGYWPMSLENALRDLYGEAFGVYEIAPLRRADVVDAAREEAVDPHAFLTAVADAGVVPLAVKPLTLRFLLARFRATGELPSSQIELYQEGVLHLCTEPSDKRLDARELGELSPRERVAVAARLAAVGWVCQRPVVVAHANAAVLSELDITVDGLAVGTEPVDGGTVALRPTAIRDVIGTGLFSGRGPGRFGWAHESYGEFLAASFLRARLSQDQVMDLLTTNVTGTARVVPQLREVAAWSVAMGPGLEAIIEADPEAIAHAAVALDNQELRAVLVDALLGMAVREGLRREMGVDYRRLLHDGLANQLLPVLTDANAPVAARELAAQIAGDTGLADTAKALGDIALDEGTPLRLRILAAYALADTGDDEARLRLRPLADGGDDDPDDELKGVALRATWPWAFEPERRFAVFARPKQSNLFGAYRSFITRELGERIGDHLVAGLDWLGAHPAQALADFDEAVEAMARQAWTRTADPAVRRAFAQVLLTALRDDHEMLRHLFPSRGYRRVEISDNARRVVLLDVIDLAVPDDAFSIAYAHPPLATGDDFGPLLERLLELGDEEAPPAMVPVVGHLFRPLDVSHSELASRVPTDHLLYRDFLSYWFEPVALDSTQAEEYRRRHQLLTPEPADPPEIGISEEELRRRITTELDAFDGGDVDAWWRCCMHLTLAPGDAVYRHERDLDPDLTALPGWAAATPADRERLVATAPAYLKRGDPRIEEWWESNSIWRSALAGYKALVLLRHESHGVLNDLDEATWARWMPVIWTFPYLRQAVGESDLQRQMVELAVQHAPDAAAEGVGRLIRRAHNRGQPLFECDLIGTAWHQAISDVLVMSVRDVRLHPAVTRDALRLLFNHGDKRVVDLAAAHLKFDAWDEDQRAIDAAIRLLAHEASLWWARVWEVMRRWPAFGRALMLSLAPSQDSSTVRMALPPDALADLYLWLVTEFPESEDPQFDDAHFVGDREQVGDFRDSIPRQLEQMGTVEALAAVKRIVVARADMPWLRHVLLGAEASVRRQAWRPLTPDQLLTLASRAHTRVVQSGEDLLDVVVATLAALQATLQGQTAMARFLWDETAGRPKTEDAISDYVADFLRRNLRDRGVVVNREVEVRRIPGAPVGERTDIQIEAALRGASGDAIDVITVVTEVKGNWNGELHTAIRDQLYARYMRDLSTSFGIYLVAWFSTEGWQQQSIARSRVAALDRQFLEAELLSHAREVASEGADIRVVILDASLPQRR